MRRGFRRPPGLRPISGATLGRRARGGYVCSACGCEVNKAGEVAPKTLCCALPRPVWFASKAEARRWRFLLMRQKEGVIRELRRQVPYDLHVNGPGQPAPLPGSPARTVHFIIKLGKYVADFVYVDDADRLVVEDVKGAGLTDIAKWKMKHLEAEYGINVQLIK